MAYDNLNANLGGPLAFGVPGASAYEVAVKNGFKGTEAEWLASLQGHTPQKGQDYFTDTDKQEIVDEVVEQVGSTGSVQPDLSQNDPEAADYVKGIIRQESLPEGYPYRKESKAIVDNQTVSLTDAGVFGVADVIPDIYEDITAGENYAVSIFNIEPGIDYGTANVVAEANGELPNIKFGDAIFEITSDGEKYHIESWSGSMTIRLSIIKTGGSEPISESYIPTTVPRTSTASVGQTIVVKAVDENGKPTEWEAVDLPQDFVVTFMTEDGVNLTADKTIAECIAAFEAGRNVRAKVYNGPNMWMNMTCSGSRNDTDIQCVEFETLQVTGNMAVSMFNLSYHSTAGTMMLVRTIPDESEA